MEKKIIVYCDGGARGNPGPAAASFVVYLDEKKVFSRGYYLGRQTNNQAEYQAVLLALKWLSESKVQYQERQVNIFLDSELIVKQLKGEYRVKKEHLKTLFGKVKVLEKNFTSLKYIHVLRQKNKIADELVNKTLDGVLMK